MPPRPRASKEDAATIDRYRVRRQDNGTGVTYKIESPSTQSITMKMLEIEANKSGEFQIRFQMREQGTRDEEDSAAFETEAARPGPACHCSCPPVKVVLVAASL